MTDNEKVVNRRIDILISREEMKLIELKEIRDARERLMDEQFLEYTELFLSDDGYRYKHEKFEYMKRLREMLEEHDPHRLLGIESSGKIIHKPEDKYNSTYDKYRWIRETEEYKQEAKHGWLMNVLNAIPEENFNTTLDGLTYISANSSLNAMPPTDFREIFNYTVKKVPDLEDIGVHFKPIGFERIYLVANGNEKPYTRHISHLFKKDIISDAKNMDIYKLVKLVENEKKRGDFFIEEIGKKINAYKNLFDNSNQEILNYSFCKLIAIKIKRVLFSINRFRYWEKCRALEDKIEYDIRERNERRISSNIGKHSKPHILHKAHKPHKPHGNQKSLCVDGKIVTYKTIMAEKGVCFNTAKKIFRQLQNAT